LLALLSSNGLKNVSKDKEEKTDGDKTV